MFLAAGQRELDADHGAKVRRSSSEERASGGGAYQARAGIGKERSSGSSPGRELIGKSGTAESIEKSGTGSARLQDWQSDSRGSSHHPLQRAGSKCVQSISTLLLAERFACMGARWRALRDCLLIARKSLHLALNLFF